MIDRITNFVRGLGTIPQQINDNYTGFLNPSPTLNEFSFIEDEQERIKAAQRAQQQADQQADFNRLGLALSFLQSGQPRTTPGLDFTPISNALANINQNMMRQRALAPQQAFNRLMMPKQLELMDSNIAKNLASNLPSTISRIDTSNLENPQFFIDENQKELTGQAFMNKLESAGNSIFDEKGTIYQNYKNSLNTNNAKASRAYFNKQKNVHDYVKAYMDTLPEVEQTFGTYNRAKSALLNATTIGYEDLIKGITGQRTKQQRSLESYAPLFKDTSVFPDIVNSVTELDNNNLSEQTEKIYRFITDANTLLTKKEPDQRKIKIDQMNKVYGNDFGQVNEETGFFEIRDAIQRFKDNVITNNIKSDTQENVTGDSPSLTTLQQDERINVEKETSQNNVSQENVPKQQEKPKNNYLQTPNMRDYQRKFFDSSNDFSFLLNEDITQAVRQNYIAKRYGVDKTLTDKDEQDINKYMSDFELRADKLKQFSGGYEKALENLEDWLADSEAIAAGTSPADIAPQAGAENIISAGFDRAARDRFINYARKAGSNVFLGSLTALKQDSSTGATGLGPVSTVELQVLIDTAGRLGLTEDQKIRNITPEVLVDNILDLIDQMETMREKALKSFGTKYRIPLLDMELQKAY
jgi:hypothetical protein